MKKRDKKLIAIAGDAAGHAKSKKSGLHPCLGNACRGQGFPSITLDILNTKFKEKAFIPPEGLLDVLQKITSKLKELLDKQHFLTDDLRVVEAEFFWNKHYPDWQCSYKVIIETESGERFEGSENPGPGYVF
ncbi:hypothetical protein [Zooshikella harenae]|uniref:Uncharacterized protein n=1 Tax=Zooshikella harenae TaxID=2827238 RepID=A0ABS5ZGI5_9GAMM|nr:hypothetical protein [Zooshikella harenae]MBU2713182.1 hypothetical protein [Zooshikella harenae]